MLQNDTVVSCYRRKMIKILKAYGIPPNLLRAIENIYYNTRATVRTPDGESEEFNISAGVLQGDTLAPFLFYNCLGLRVEAGNRGAGGRPWVHNDPEEVQANTNGNSHRFRLCRWHLLTLQ